MSREMEWQNDWSLIKSLEFISKGNEKILKCLRKCLMKDIFAFSGCYIETGLGKDGGG